MTSEQSLAEPEHHFEKVGGRRVRVLYSNGHPFGDQLRLNLDKIKDRVRVGKASLIIIDGGLGEGKTTLGVEVADYFQGEPIVFELQLAMGGEETIKKIKVCYEKGRIVIIYDEAGDFNKRGALTKLNATLNRIFEIFRAFKIIVIVILPSFSVLDNALFDKKIPRLLLHCHGRSGRSGNYSAYSLYRMFWIKERMRRSVVKPDAFRQVQPNFRGHFLNLPFARSQLLDEFSTRGKLNVVDIAVIHHEGLMTYKDLALKLDRTHGWVRQKIAALGLKPRKVFKGANYFGQDVLKRLEVIKLR